MCIKFAKISDLDTTYYVKNAIKSGRLYAVKITKKSGNAKKYLIA